MRIYAGIDEAGYGPMLGPLVIGRSVFRINDDDFDNAPPSLWDRWPDAVCQALRDKKHRIAIADSKKVYKPKGGLRNLERGVLGFMRLVDLVPGSVEDLLSMLAIDANCGFGPQPWYTPNGNPPVTIPRDISEPEIKIAGSQLRTAMSGVGDALVNVGAAVVYEDRFNHMVAATRSKAACSWTFVASHLVYIWERFGSEHPYVVVDRQGGRKAYLTPLRLAFDGADFTVLQESKDTSQYRITRQGRSMTVSFETGGETRHLPIALGSMIAKYIRELVMIRFNSFWSQHITDLKPTAGYVQDGRRFMKDIDPALRKLDINPNVLIRQR